MVQSIVDREYRTFLKYSKLFPNKNQFKGLMVLELHTIILPFSPSFKYCTYENVITIIMAIVIITYCLISLWKRKKGFLVMNQKSMKG